MKNTRLLVHLCWGLEVQRYAGGFSNFVSDLLQRRLKGTVIPDRYKAGSLCDVESLKHRLVLGIQTQVPLKINGSKSVVQISALPNIGTNFDEEHHVVWILHEPLINGVINHLSLPFGQATIIRFLDELGVNGDIQETAIGDDQLSARLLRFLFGENAMGKNPPFRFEVRLSVGRVGTFPDRFPDQIGFFVSQLQGLPESRLSNTLSTN